jgi:hypothetical protein
VNLASPSIFLRLTIIDSTSPSWEVIIPPWSTLKRGRQQPEKVAERKQVHRALFMDTGIYPKSFNLLSPHVCEVKLFPSPLTICPFYRVTVLHFGDVMWLVFTKIYLYIYKYLVLRRNQKLFILSRKRGKLYIHETK